MDAKGVKISSSNQMLASCDGARRAMFAAATRVIQYHQATLDEKVERLLQAELKYDVAPSSVRNKESMGDSVAAIAASC